MKPFLYLCLGAILSSLLHELFPLRTLLLLLPPPPQFSSSHTNAAAVSDKSDNNDRTSIAIQWQREHASSSSSDNNYGNNNWSDDSDNYDDDTKNQKRTTPKLADGCYHVFLDVGSNIGVTGRMLLEPQLYPPLPMHAPKKQQQQQQQQTKRGPRRLKSRNGNTANKKNNDKSNQSTFTSSARQFFVSQFGPESNRIPTEYCIFAFEPNPMHADRQLELQAAYTAMGWRYHYIQAGVSDTNGSMTFYHVGKGDKLLERGFTTVESKCRTSRKKRDCPSEQVQVYRLSDWIEREVRGRILPAATSSVASSSSSSTSITTQTLPRLPPKVVMKMDIEMAEWLVLPDLLTSGVLCRDVDAMLAEFHTGGRHENEYPIRFASQAREPQQEPGGSTSSSHESGNGNNVDNSTTKAIAWILESYRDAERLKNEMMNMIHHNPNCKAMVVEGDDESYGRDGMPLPFSSASPASGARGETD